MQIGTGWLGWTEAATLATAIPTIELAYEGLTEKLYAIQVSGFKKPEAKQAEISAPANEIFGAFRVAATQGH